LRIIDLENKKAHPKRWLKRKNA